MDSGSLIGRYAVAIVAAALAVAVRLVLDPLLGEGHLPYLTLFATVVFVGWYAGLGPAVVSLALGALAAQYFIVPPEFAWTLTGPHVISQLMMYLIFGAACALLGHTVRRVQRRAETSAQLALERLKQLEREIDDRKRTEQALREREERYELVVAGAEAAIWDWDVPRKRVAYSPRWKDLRGLSDDEVSDSEEEWSKAIHPDDAPRVMAAIQAHFEGHTPVFAEEYRVRHKDGHWIWILDRGIARRDASGRVVRMAGSETDITERKLADDRLQRRDQQLQLVTDATPALISYLDRDQRYRFVNRHYETRFGRPREEVIGKSMTEMLGEAAMQRLRPYVERVLSGENVRFEEEVVYRDGGTRWIDAHYVPNRDAVGEVVGFFALVLDITDRKQAEQALKEADRRKDEFLATLAHELRNPLAPIRHAAEILRLQGPADPELEQARDVIDRQTQHMTRLVDDLLDMSRVTRGRLELRKECVELATAVQAAVETSRPLIDAKGHALIVTIPPEPIHLDADLTRLAQVFSNLLNNAAKYMDHGGRIDVVARREGSDAVVSVRDDGVGVPEEMLGRVFDLFAQAIHSVEQSQGGLGIGLTLTKRLVEMHGGSIEARSEGAGRGSEFIVRLPIRIETPDIAEPSIPAAASAPFLSPARRVLVVDDNRDAADSLAMLLKLFGSDTRVAHDGIEAVRQAEAFQPDIVLLDIGLPEMNGYEVCRAIRQQAWGQNIAMIAVTGWGQEEDRRKSKEAGFDDHLVKPVDVQKLQEILSEVTTRYDRTANSSRSSSLAAADFSGG